MKHAASRIGIRLLINAALLSSLLITQAIFADSIGQSDDPRIAVIPEGAQRFYFAGEGHHTSVRPNTLGDDQVLFYDVYAPTSEPSGMTAIFIHGGGYQSGAANSTWQRNYNVVDICRQIAAEGFWVVSMEYRRGWRGDGGDGVANIESNSADYERFLRAVELARIDVLDGWEHLDSIARPQLNLPDVYVLIGRSAGGSLASRVTLTNENLNKKVGGVIVGFGAHSINEFVMPFEGTHKFPVVLQGGLTDDIQPAYSNHPWFDTNLPLGKGMFNLYEELRVHGYPVRMYISAQQGHGFGAYIQPDRTAEYYPWALSFFADYAKREADERSFIEYKFDKPDPNYPELTPGTRINTLEQPDFSYEPFQTQLKAGIDPKLLDW